MLIINKICLICNIKTKKTLIFLNYRLLGDRLHTGEVGYRDS